MRSTSLQKEMKHDDKDPAPTCLERPPILTDHRLHNANHLEQSLHELEVENYFPMGCRGVNGQGTPPHSTLQIPSTP